MTAIAKRTFLIVEDEALIAMSLSADLVEAGAKDVQLAMSVKEANTLIKDNNFDAAILDLRLPDGTTYDVARKLTQKGSGVIFHSGHAQSGEILAEFPTAQFCRKPCEFDRFIDAMQVIQADKVQA